MPLLSSLFTLLLVNYPVTLAWAPNPDPTVVGYKLYYGTHAGEYTNMVDVGNRLQTVLDLKNAQQYFAVVTAYNNKDLESDFSAELNYTVPFKMNFVRSMNGPLVVYTISTSVFTGMHYQILASKDLVQWLPAYEGVTTSDQLVVSFNEPPRPVFFYQITNLGPNFSLSLLESELTYRNPTWFEKFKWALRYRGGRHPKPRHGAQDILR